MCFFADLCIFVPLFLFCSFCSAIFVPLFLFCWGLFALKPHLPHYLIDNFCSADLFALALTNFCSTTIFVWLGFHLFLFHRYFCSAGAFFCSTIFVPLGLFCSAIFFHYFCWGLLFLFHWGLFLFRYFCSTGAFFGSAIFVPLTFLHLHLPIFVPLFLFRWGLFALKLKPIFVPLFLFCWGLFLFCYFCSTIFVLLTFLHLHLPIFVPLFLFRWGLFAFALSPPIFVWVTQNNE